VQFAVSPDEKDIVAIEINPRALVLQPWHLKRQGIQLQRLLQISVGYNLDELQNQITKSTSAFEPTWIMCCKNSTLEL
jgi:carbamoyl-phosphate synthase large subunit